MGVAAAGEDSAASFVAERVTLDMEEVCDGVLSKEASNLEEGAGTICGSTLHKRRDESCKDFYTSLKYMSGSSGPLASGGTCVLNVDPINDNVK